MGVLFLRRVERRGEILFEGGVILEEGYALEGVGMCFEGGGDMF